MAKQLLDEDSERIVDINVSDEMESSFLEYAYSVIYSRALPDARDGLKPVQRRILYSMDEMGIKPDKGHVKCARVVGQVMGVLHPHGDGAIYDALVRTAQPWAMRLPLVDGHGNFGSLDAGPAAMRYTECRMASSAVAMTEGLAEDTVDFRPNYDGKETEPAVLPAAFPNLLVNGSTGIAVGMATNIAPHNLLEVVQALKHLLKNPTADLEDLMKFIPGPDLPTGGKIIGLDGIRDAYETGRGTFKVRAEARIEKVSARRQGIVVTALPYMVGPEKIIEQIKTALSSKKLTGIADLKDLSDHINGTRLVIEVKNGINPEALLEQLYKVTKLEDSFAINAVALVDGQPRVLSLKELLSVYLDHRLEVTTRRTQYQLSKANDRLHIVQGLMIAIADIDKVIAIIRDSEDVAQARQRLVESFSLTEVQANYILDMQLRRLTKYSIIELEKEENQLSETIAGLTNILENDSVLRDVVAKDLTKIAKEFGTPRRTVLLAASGAKVPSAPLEVPDDPCWILLSATGLAARTDCADQLSNSGPRANHDTITSAILASAHSEFGVITDRGRLIKARAIELPTVPVTADAINLQGGSIANELWNLADGEKPLALTRLSSDSLGLALGTKNGVVKRVNPEVLANKDSWDVIRLDDDDYLVGACELASEEHELTFITTQAQLLHFPAKSVRPQGRSGGGMAGIKLPNGAEVLFFGAVPPEGALTVTVSGSSKSLPGTEVELVKVTDFAEYPGKGRATGGVRCHRFLKDEDALVSAWAGPAPAIATTTTGIPIELPQTYGKRDGSGIAVSLPIFAIGSRTH